MGLISFLVLWLGLGATSEKAHPPLSSLLQWGVGSARAAGVESLAPVYPPAGLVDLDNPSGAAILRHEIQASLDPATGGLQALDRITVLHAPGVPAAKPWPFLLWKELEVESVRGEGVTLRSETPERMNPRSFWRRPPYDELGGFEQTHEVRLLLDSADIWPETLRVAVRYSGTIRDSLHAPKAAYARSFETTSGLIEPRGAFLAGSSFWVPWRPGEVFTFTCEAEVPPDWRAVSQGGLAGSREVNQQGRDRRIDQWNCPHPMDEVYLIAGPWRLSEIDHKGIQAETFTYANTDSTIIRRYLDGTGDYLDLYSGLIGPYPFAKFALVENFWQTGFGMPSFTLLGDRVIRLPFILHTSYGHEILHNWWGNSVFVASAGGNWCEGLTTYGADYLYKVRESREAAREYRLNALSGYQDYVSSQEDIPLSRFRERHDFATQAVGYSKSMMVIHQLFRQAGEDRFWESLQDFYKKNIWRRASWSDLLDCFQERAGIPAKPFEEAWILRPGAPAIGLKDVKRTAVSGAWHVQATLYQELVHAGTDTEPYPLTLPVRLRWAAGGDTTWQVPLDTWETAWSVSVDREPTSLALDPDYEVMRRIDRREIPPTLSRVLGSDTVSVLIASGLDPGTARAFRDLAAEWSKGQTLRVIAEDSLRGLPWNAPGSVWLLGLGPTARERLLDLVEVRRLPSQWLIAGKDYPDSASIVLTGNSPGPGSGAWALISVPDSSQVAVIGAKVPHYGKYSYLAFEAGQNAGRGVWSHLDSPLIVDLTRNTTSR